MELLDFINFHSNNKIELSKGKTSSPNSDESSIRSNEEVVKKLEQLTTLLLMKTQSNFNIDTFPEKTSILQNLKYF